jgi:fumarate hydratase class II
MSLTGKSKLWGAETEKAIENFPISGETIPRPLIHWLGRVKQAAAEVNGELGLLDSNSAGQIARAASEIGEGKHDDQFPVDVFQTGSGTSSNMNTNEVIANLAGEEAHATQMTTSIWANHQMMSSPQQCTLLC